MKRIATLLLALYAFQAYSQDNEFTIHQNGLIYDNSTMARLRFIVDSLNLKFRSCEMTSPYLAIEQGLATFVTVPSSTARKDIEEGISIVEFQKRYPSLIQGRDLLVIKRNFKDYEGISQISIETFPGSKNQFSLKAETGYADSKQGWLLAPDKDEAVFLHGMQSPVLPDQYGRLIMYADCMIDTTATIYTTETRAIDARYAKTGPEQNRFISIAEDFPGKPEYPDHEKVKDSKWKKAYNDYRAKYRTWDSLRLTNLDKRMNAEAGLRELLSKAKAEAIESGSSSDNLEFYVERYISAEDALAMKRDRKVMGMCSQDQSPRYHAINIARLAAHTAKWEIFLRSHLDVMNDRFERRSDGSYAWAGRKTYLKELEELDIDAVDLLLGICLRVQNVSDNHYWGSIGRVGRALSEVEDQANLEQRLSGMITDPQLDHFNRLLLAYLYSHYTYNLKDKKRRNQNENKLNELVAAMPEEMRMYWGD